MSVFVETPIFHRLIGELLNDEGLRALQNELLENPKKGTVIRGGGGLRKVRFTDPSRGKGKRGGIRVIYAVQGERITLLLAYSKDVQDDLTPRQVKILRNTLEEE